MLIRTPKTLKDPDDITHAQGALSENHISVLIISGCGLGVDDNKVILDYYGCIVTEAATWCADEHNERAILYLL